MNQALGHFCAHTGLIWPGEPAEDGDMSEMTLSSRHRIRNIKSWLYSKDKLIPRQQCITIENCKKK